MRTLTKTISLLLVLVFLAGCDISQPPADLTPEEAEAIRTEIVELKDKIDNFEGEEGSLPVSEIVALARDYEELGEYKKAVKLYEDTMATGKKARAVIHNLGRLYEKLEQYDKAIEQYQIMVDELFNSDYLYDITWAYIKSGDRKNAEKYFNQWQLETNSTDVQTQQAIKEMREAE